ncbi:hypothetical protein SISSUDRAFT_986622 [Sistotremastrum suecicum HHB10207 ss-3]|uniref:DUF1989 domain-containing protein n=1 Tax=Sistotremastrum suecicum HHB10207 ss-3 TaxID=1314776 RepID=A0A166D6G5_9AGAM|nr:hypothetical protein SISSUDRAFT_986622 [Sistotremastrum suecicum HHB10207 ss-3]
MSSSRLTQAAYQSFPGGPLEVDRAFYDTVAQCTRAGAGKLIQEFVLPIRSGRAWKMEAGNVCRIITPEGPQQVGDLNLWHLHNPKERFWAARTRQLQRAHVSVYDRLWSTLPYLRPMCTITSDSLSDYGVDKEGGRVHDLLGTRCDPYVNKMLSGKDFDFHCHSNLVRAIEPHGLQESDVHDVLNVFQSTGLNDKDQYFMKTCPAVAGSYFEFFAEIDLLCALSTCPGGDLSKAMWGEGSEGEDPNVDPTLECCRPLKVEVWELPEESLKDWKHFTAAKYEGSHGLAKV